MSRVRGDDVLPPLPAGLPPGLSGPALVRAALAAARQGGRDGPRAPRWVPVRRPTLQTVTAPPMPAEPVGWTPHDAVPTTFTPGHWADGTPIPDDEPDGGEW